MKKTSADPELDLDDNLRPHYDFDFKTWKPNRFAGMDLKFKGRPPIVLDADVAEVFDSPEVVNTVLRSVIKATRTSTFSGKAKKATAAVMKKKDSSDLDLDDDLRPRYPAEFFRNMKPNRFAGMDLKFKGGPPIVLDADVAEVFDSPEAVNTVLRTVIKAMRSSTSGGKRKTVAKATASPRIAAKRRGS